jgi:hypothetical protein
MAQDVSHEFKLCIIGAHGGADYSVDRGRRIKEQGQPDKIEALSEKQTKKVWRCGTSGRGPKFKLQYRQKKKKNHFK